MASHCENCERKMKCTYSEPVNARVTYRTYKCEGCDERRATVEFPEGMFDNISVIDYRNILDKLKAIRSKRVAVVRAIRRKKTTPS